MADHHSQINSSELAAQETLSSLANFVFSENKQLPSIFAENFWVLEGPDGSGKSTLWHNIQNKIAADQRFKQLPILWIKDPGSSQLGQKIREILLNPELSICPSSELLLYLASRSQMVHEKILPFLEKGGLVISDRFSLSTFIYQIAQRFHGREVDWLPILGLAANKLVPGKIFVLNAPWELLQERIYGRGQALDRMELNLSYLQKVSATYQEFCSLNPKYTQLKGLFGESWHLLEAKESSDQVLAELWKIIEPHLLKMTLSQSQLSTLVRS